MVNSDTYDQEVTRLSKKQDWAALELYCRVVEREMRYSIRDGAATENDHRLRLQALSDLQTAYLMLERPKERIRAALEAHRARKKTPYTPDTLGDYFSCESLARAYAANSQAEQAREMFLCAGASMITRRQAEFLGNALLDLAAFEREQADPQKANMLEELAEGIKRASKKMQRATQKSLPPAENLR